MRYAQLAQRLAADSELRPHRDLGNLRVYYRPRIRVQQGSQTDEVCCHERLPLHDRYWKCESIKCLVG